MPDNYTAEEQRKLDLVGDPDRTALRLLDPLWSGRDE
jgi:hypothetical protein